MTEYIRDFGRDAYLRKRVAIGGSLLTIGGVGVTLWAHRIGLPYLGPLANNIVEHISEVVEFGGALMLLNVVDHRPQDDLMEINSGDWD